MKWNEMKMNKNFDDTKMILRWKMMMKWYDFDDFWWFLMIMKRKEKRIRWHDYEMIRKWREIKMKTIFKDGILTKWEQWYEERVLMIWNE